MEKQTILPSPGPMRLAMGNEAIALGALRAGVRFVAGYPGTPSTEILETVAREKGEDVYVEWSVNEKTAMEAAAGAVYSGARAMVTMKQVGLNVASDPLMSLAYVGVKGGLVVVVADDPGPISSQTEQDTRTFALFSRLPVFDPASPEEAYLMIADAFELSERCATPVLFRPTTRICHGRTGLHLLPDLSIDALEGFVRDPGRWVIFPRLAFQNHLKIEKRNAALSDEFSSYIYNEILENSRAKVGIAAGGVSVNYAMEALTDEDDARILKIATPHPFPEKLALRFLTGLSRVIVFEELDPVIERALIFVVGKYHLNTVICGKLSGDTACAGENSVESIRTSLDHFLYGKTDAPALTAADAPPLPARPPVLCAGCPHRASFLAVKTASRHVHAIYTGDIGCYTLGNAAPLNMVDTCLCMGAGITIAQGLSRTNPGALPIAFVGDSTFFASGIPGVINAVYNGTELLLIVLDNETTAMTGSQPHPGTGKTMMGKAGPPRSIPQILKSLGANLVLEVDPMDQRASVEAVKTAIRTSGVRAVIFRAPCVSNRQPDRHYHIDPAKCTACKVCVRQVGCPAIFIEGRAISIRKTLCAGCGLCEQICPSGAIGEDARND